LGDCATAAIEQIYGEGSGDVTDDTQFQLDDELDSLFKLKPGDFVSGRNALSARLKKAGRNEDAERVRGLTKPPISAWVVNQLYWNHRDAFKQLMEAGERFVLAHASQLSGQTTDVQGALGARTEALTTLSRLAAMLLRDTGHNPAPDMMRRILATLEALSTYSSFPDAPTPGHLIADIDPPGFESLAALVPGVPGSARTERPAESPRTVASGGTARIAGSKREREYPDREAAARAALDNAERVLRETRAAVRDLAEELKQAAARANKTEKERLEAEERFRKASTLAEEASGRLGTLSAEAEKAADALHAAESAVERARQELHDVSGRTRQGR
jgi:hypothetical protein